MHVELFHFRKIIDFTVTFRQFFEAKTSNVIKQTVKVKLRL